MIKKIQLFCLALFITLSVCAQTAPVTSFSLSTTPCIGQGFAPVNSTTSGTPVAYSWSTFPNTSTILPTSSAANPTISLATAGNYTLSLVATNSVGATTYTLAINNVTACPVCLDTIRMIKKADTLKTYIAPSNSLILGCQSGFTGFLTGTNCYKDKEFAQYYPPSSYSNTAVPQVNSVLVLFDSTGTYATASTQGTQIYCKIYGGTVGNGPSSLIAARTDSLGKIAASTKTNTVKYCGSPTYTFTTTKIIPFMFNFATPVLITASGFFASVQTPYTSAVDSIKIFSNTKTNLSNDSSSWVLQYSNNWRTMRYNKSAKIQLAILPIISCRPVVGIEEHKTDFSSNINIMPNPNNGQFSLVFTLIKQSNINVKIFNSFGQLISTNALENVVNNVINIDLQSRASGVYFIEISNDNERVLKKVIISN